MKKAFMLVVAIALLAAPVFAEITVSGQVEMIYEHLIAGDTSESYESYDDDDENSLAIDLGIEIGEFTTINTGLEATMDDTTYESAVELDGWSITQDITGAVGADGPISFSVEMGDVGFGGKQYTDELDALTDYDEDDQPYGHDMDGSAVDFNFAIGIMDMVTVEIGFLPGTFADIAKNNDDDGADDVEDDDAATAAVDESADNNIIPDVVADQFGINVYGVFGPASLAAYFVTNDGNNDMEINGLLDFAPVEAGFQLQFVNLEDVSDLFTYVYATYTSDFGLEATVEYFGYSMIENIDMDFAVEATYEIAVGSATVDANWGFMNILEATAEMDMEVGVGVSYPMSDVVELHANFDIEKLLVDAGESILVNVGSDLAIGAMSYELNYTLGTENVGTEEISHTLGFLGTVSF